MTEDSKEQWQYRVPIGGVYQVNMKTWEPTGEWHWVDNFGRKWWQLWKPKKLYREKYRMVELINENIVVEKDEHISIKSAVTENKKQVSVVRVGPSRPN